WRRAAGRARTARGRAGGGWRRDRPNRPAGRRRADLTGRGRRADPTGPGGGAPGGSVGRARRSAVGRARRSARAEGPEVAIVGRGAGAAAQDACRGGVRTLAGRRPVRHKTAEKGKRKSFENLSAGGAAGCGDSSKLF